MKRILEQIFAFLSHHNKMFLLRFDLHLPKYTNDNTEISKLIHQIKIKLTNLYKLKRIGYIWVREQEKAKQQHYHLILLLDGNKVQQPQKIIAVIQLIWKTISNGTVAWPSRCYYQISRNDHQLLQEAIYHGSYLAKARGKGYRPNQTKDYGASRLVPKESEG